MNEHQTSVVRLIEENGDRSIPPPPTKHEEEEEEEEEDMEAMLRYEPRTESVEPDEPDAAVVQIEGTTWQYRLNRWWYHPEYDAALPRCLATSPRRWAMLLLALIAITAVTIGLIVHM